jgi:hypothetical protein
MVCSVVCCQRYLPILFVRCNADTRCLQNFDSLLPQFTYIYKQPATASRLTDAILTLPSSVLLLADQGKTEVLRLTGCQLTASASIDQPI